MKKKILVLSVTLALLLSANLRAQVTIGALTAPTAGALLDLNRGIPGGLLLSNIPLDDLGKIPATGFVGITSAQDRNSELVGMIVYNTDATTGIGIYVWDGDDWIKPCAPPAPGPITFSGPSCSVTAGVAPVPGATSYVWELPQGLTISGAPDGATITIIGTAATYPIGSITVRAVSSCGGGTRRESAQPVTLLGAPAAPGAITFTATKICGVGTTFTAGVTPVAGATSYVWTLPNGLTGSSTGTSITIGWTTEGVYLAGSISVQAVNSCGAAGASSSSTQAVTVGAIPAAPTDATISNSGNTFTFGATPPTGCTIDWYDSATGGTKVATGVPSYSTTISGTTSYYAESRNTITGCVSASRLEVKAITILSVSDCDLTHSYGGSIITNSENVRFINDAEYTRNGITLSAPVKIVGRSARSDLASSSNTLVDYRDHSESTANYGSWFTWCMVATHADILCPSPWRVPTVTDFQNYSGISISSGSTTLIYGRPFATASEAIDGWLLGGETVRGLVDNVGTSGFYWSSTEGGPNNGYYARVNSSNFYPSITFSRYIGFSLRCVKTAP